MLVLAMLLSPIVTLLYLTALDSISPELIEAAVILDCDRNVWQRIALPLALPALLGGMGLVFALTLVEYGVPALFQFNVYSMEIHAEFSQSGDPVVALGLAMPLLLAAVAIVASSQAGWRQMPLRSRPGGCPPLQDLSPPVVWHKTPVMVLSIAALAPVVALVFQARSIGTVWHAATAARREIGLSLSLALGTALSATGIALPSALALARRRLSGGIWSLYALPLAIPAPLYAIGLINLLNQPQVAPIYGSPVVLLLAHVGRFLPHAVFALATQFSRIDPSLHEAARLYPIGRLRRAARVHVPLLAPGLIACATIVFVLSLGELGASLLVVPPGSATISLRLFNLLHYGATASVSGLALILLVLVGAIGTVALSLLQRRRR
jgi:iron(III) transport system permease protein